MNARPLDSYDQKLRRSYAQVSQRGDPVVPDQWRSVIYARSLSLERLTRGFERRVHNNAACVPKQTPDGALADVVRGLTAISNIGGLLVTMPHKFTDFDYCATGSETARLFGVVSASHRNPDGTWRGDMLDVLAFV